MADTFPRCEVRGYGSPPSRGRRSRVWARCPPSAVTRSRLHCALHARIDGVERCRAADVKSVSLLTAEAQIGDGFRYVDFSKEIAVPRVAAHAILVRVAPTHRAPDASFGVTAHPVGNAGPGHVCEDLAVRRLSGGHIQIERANMRRILRSIREPGVAYIELLLVGREGKAIGFDEVIDDDLDLAGFRIDPVDVMLFLLGLGL